MTAKELAEHMGNIDQRLIDGAGQAPNYGRRKRAGRIRRTLALYLRAARRGEGLDEAGYLFTVECHEGSCDPAAGFAARQYVIASTPKETYFLILPSDVQYDPNNAAVAREYQTLASRSATCRCCCPTGWGSKKSRGTVCSPLAGVTTGSGDTPTGYHVYDACRGSSVFWVCGLSVSCCWLPTQPMPL